jgi:hypothetical protein
LSSRLARSSAGVSEARPVVGRWRWVFREVRRVVAAWEV